MNGNNHDNNTDFRNVKASVIGELRKDKIGRPFLVIELLVIFLIVMISLPFINNMLNDENGYLYKMLHGSTPTVTPNVPVKKEYEDASVKQLLNHNTSMKFENLILKNFILSGNKITVTLSSYNGILNLDQKAYYLYLYSTSDNLLAHVKLTGNYDNSDKQVELTSYGLSFNSNMSYSGMVVEMQDRDYPNYELSSDESGIASFVCKMNNRTIEYTFKNNYLIGIKDNYIVKLEDLDNSDDYLNLKKTYDEKAKTLGTVASNVEENDGFVFNASFNLENYRIPTSIKDYDYYPLDTEAKVIHYAETGKGFDCE